MKLPLLFLSLISIINAESTSFSFVGNGFCTTEDGDYYDYLHFDNVASEQQCGSSVYCGRSFVRGFSYNEGTKWCYCFIDDSWISNNAVPADITDMHGYSPLPFVSGTARGIITSSNEQEWFKCFSNNQFGIETNNLYYFVGDGSCMTNSENNESGERYNYISYAGVKNIEVCASYCGQKYYRGFSYDDAENCECFFDSSAEATAAVMEWKTLPGYIYSYFENTGRGSITSSDKESMVRKCYSNDYIDDQGSDPSNPSGSSRQQLRGSFA